MATQSAVRIDYPIRLSTSQLPKFELHPTNQLRLKYQICTISEAAEDPVSSNKENGERSSQTWNIKMLYDGDCPLCMSEVNMLRERNRRYGTIKFVDISSDGYTSEENEGLHYKTVMRRIHAILADGTVVRDVEAFKRLYEQVGLGWVYAVTKYEPVKHDEWILRSYSFSGPGFRGAKLQVFGHKEEEKSYSFSVIIPNDSCPEKSISICMSVLYNFMPTSKAILFTNRICCWVNCFHT